MKKCIFISIRDNEVYVNLNKIFMDIVLGRGVTQVMFETVRQTETDYSALAVKVSSVKDADCLFLSAPAGVAANLLTQFRQAGLDPSIRVLGHNSLNSPDLTRIGGTAVEGVFLEGDWAPGGANEMGRMFAANFQKKHGLEPDNWSAVGYSAGQVIADAIKRSSPNVTRESFASALAATKNVPVIVGGGLYSYDAERMPQYGMVILQVKDGKFVAAP